MARQEPMPAPDMHEAAQLPHVSAAEYAAHLFDGGLSLPSVVLMPPAGEFGACGFLDGFRISRCPGIGGLAGVAIQQHRVIPQLVGERFPVLIEAVVRGSSEVGLPR